MKEGWFERFLNGINGEDSYYDLAADEQGLFEKGVHVKKKGWFTRLYRRVSGKDMEEEFKAHQERMKDKEYREKIFEGFDDKWLMSEFEDIHGIVSEVDAGDEVKEHELIIFKDQYYIPLEGTIHEVDLRYQMEHSN